MKEIFKNIPNFEGYQVSNLGRVKSLKGKKERVLKLFHNQSTGYLQVCVSVCNKKIVKRIHQFVAMAFLNHQPNDRGLVVDHIDNNQLNNRVDNLQLITLRNNLSKDKKGGSSKYVGVSWSKANKKWTVRINIKMESVFLGRFTNELEAAKAYQNKLLSL